MTRVVWIVNANFDACRSERTRLKNCHIIPVFGKSSCHFLDGPMFRAIDGYSYHIHITRIKSFWPNDVRFRIVPTHGLWNTPEDHLAIVNEITLSGASHIGVTSMDRAARNQCTVLK